MGRVTDNNGNVLTDQNEIEQFLVKSYEDLYKVKYPDKSKYHKFFQGLPVIEDNILGQEVINKITREEVADAISKAKSGKCPGRDGIPIEFYKTFSTLLVPYITKLFNNCMESGNFPLSWRDNIMKLIPKNEDLDISFNNLRPLCMGNVDRKLYASIWFRRLVKTSGDIINNSQTGGVPGRAIQGSTLLLHLLISYYGEKGLEGYIVITDNFKAFDSVIREYLWDVMKIFGYSNYTVNNIKKLYDCSNARICINGFLTRDFALNSGVIQGCPLSSLLYVISGEPLARAIHNSIEIEGFRLPTQQEVKMIQHVDDVTLTLQRQRSILKVLDLIGQYGEVCGTKLNKSKSFIIKLGDSSVAHERLRDDFNGIKIVSQHDNHGCKKILGILFSAVPVTYIDKNYFVVTKKCQEILDTWDDRNLSLVGRVLVVNSLVISKLVYVMQTLDITKRRLGFLKQRISKFIWKGMGSKLKLSILEWGKDRGGLGLVPVDLKARALRLKTIKDYLGKSEGGRDIGPITQILAYFLDVTVRASLYNDLGSMHQLFQDPITGRGGILSRQQNRDHHLKYFLEDIREFKNFELQYQDIGKWDSVFYLKRLVANRTELEQATMKNDVFMNKIHFYRQHFSGCQEKQVWKNWQVKGLDPKVKAFNYKMINNLLPVSSIIGHGGNDKFCKYCLLKRNLQVVESVEHVFISCIVAKMVWAKLNLEFHKKGMGGIEVDRETILYKIGIQGDKVLLVSEVNWALWKNRNNNVHSVANNLGSAVVVHKVYHARFEKLMKVDRVVLSGTKFRKRWGGIETIV